MRRGGNRFRGGGAPVPAQVPAGVGWGDNVGMTFDNLLDGPPPTHLPVEPAAAELQTGAAATDVVRRHPASSAAWAELAEQALAAGRELEGYAFARVGYHRGLDALRRNGWRGHGPVPWDHEPNRGFLRCLAALARASDLIGDTQEAVRCRQLLTDSDPDAPR